MMHSLVFMLPIISFEVFLYIIALIVLYIVSSIPSNKWCCSTILFALCQEVGLGLITQIFHSSINPELSISMTFFTTVIFIYIAHKCSIHPLSGTLKGLAIFLGYIAITLFYSRYVIFPGSNDAWIATVTTFFKSSLICPSWKDIIVALVGKCYLLVFLGLIINAFSGDSEPSLTHPLPTWYWNYFVYHNCIAISGLRHTKNKTPRSRRSRPLWYFQEFIFRLQSKDWLRRLLCWLDPNLKEADKIVKKHFCESSLKLEPFPHTYLLIAVYIHCLFKEFSKKDARWIQATQSQITPLLNQDIRYWDQESSEMFPMCFCNIQAYFDQARTLFEHREMHSQT